MVPPTRVITVEAMKKGPGLIAMVRPSAFGVFMPIAIAKACPAASSTVR